MAKNSFWTEKRTARLMELYSKHSGTKSCFDKISRRLVTKHSYISSNACYKKLGRMGVLNARWSRMESQK